MFFLKFCLYLLLLYLLFETNGVCHHLVHVFLKWSCMTQDLFIWQNGIIFTIILMVSGCKFLGIWECTGTCLKLKFIPVTKKYLIYLYEPHIRDSNQSFSLFSWIVCINNFVYCYVRKPHGSRDFTVTWLVSIALQILQLI